MLYKRPSIFLLYGRQVNALLPTLNAESEIKETFIRMDHNGDGVIDLTDFLMWEERMEDGKANTDFWALQEVTMKTYFANRVSIHLLLFHLRR